jgi:ubiquinone/menaquinone biosynthesis C-methylase UbiE
MITSSVSFDRAAAYYDATRGFPPGVAEQVRDAIVGRLAVSREDRIIELGVGTGRVALPFLTAGYRYTGVDISAEMLAVFRGKLGALAAPLALVQADVGRLPVANGRFDLAIAVHLLHLVADWRATLRETRRILRPGGALLLAGSPGTRSRHNEDELVAPPDQARRLWLSTLEALGASPSAGQPGVRMEDPQVADYLAELGAAVERVVLLEYRHTPLSARDVLRQHQERIYSSDWALPDDVHRAAVARLERWLAESCPDPDTAYRLPARFHALLARW